ncbi:MAG: hypothetical protein IJS47_01240 [Clostridia bacterium]|nr:hypothetical protein [Clostridia bacterium]
MTDEEKSKVEKVIRDLAQNMPSFPEERVLKAISSMTSLKTPKNAIEKLAMRLEDIFGTNPDFKEFYEDALNKVLTIDENAFQNIEELLKQVKFNKTHNINPGDMSLEDNHALVNCTLKTLCDKLNMLGVDYYLGGAVSAFIATGVPLFRYHGDLDFNVAEKDIDKVREALEGTDFVFEDNRLTTKRTYDHENGMQGEHEVIARHKANEFHLGFIVFDRHEDGSINIKEYYKERKDGKDVLMTLVRHLPKEAVELEFSADSVEYFGTSVRTLTPEYIYYLKSFIDRQKDNLDMEILTDKIDHEKIGRLRTIWMPERTVEVDSKCR